MVTSSWDRQIVIRLLQQLYCIRPGPPQYCGFRNLNSRWIHRQPSARVLLRTVCKMKVLGANACTSSLGHPSTTKTSNAIPSVVLNTWASWKTQRRCNRNCYEIVGRSRNGRTSLALGLRERQSQWVLGRGVQTYLNAQLKRRRIGQSWCEEVEKTMPVRCS
jgi:hypothetical protein